MFHSLSFNSEINGIPERALRSICNVKSSSFLFKKCLIRITWSQYTIQFLSILQLKHTNFYRAPSILNQVFVEQDCNYNLLGNNFLNKQRLDSVRYGTESSGVILSQKFIWYLDAALNDLFFSKIYFIKSSIYMLWT